MTTLDASTIFPENREQTSTFLEVATIRSPYSFTFEEEMSTRFITVTRCVQLFFCSCKKLFKLGFAYT